MINKRYVKKHGWKFLVMENASQHSKSSKTNENRRGTAMLN